MSVLNCQHCMMPYNVDDKTCKKCGANLTQQDEIQTRKTYKIALIGIAILLFFITTVAIRHNLQQQKTHADIKQENENEITEYIYSIRKAGFRCDDFVDVFSKDDATHTVIVEVHEIRGSSVTSGFKINMVNGKVERRW